jgi:hypothetical protein
VHTTHTIFVITLPSDQVGQYSTHIRSCRIVQVLACNITGV